MELYEVTCEARNVRTWTTSRGKAERAAKNLATIACIESNAGADAKPLYQPGGPLYPEIKAHPFKLTKQGVCALLNRVEGGAA